MSQSVALLRGVNVGGKNLVKMTERASQSRLSRIVTMAIYQNMTIRSWNTVIKLLQMMDAS